MHHKLRKKNRGSIRGNKCILTNELQFSSPPYCQISNWLLLVKNVCHCIEIRYTSPELSLMSREAETVSVRLKSNRIIGGKDTAKD